MERKAQSVNCTQKRIDVARVPLGSLELISTPSRYPLLLSTRLPARFGRALLIRGATIWLLARILAIATLAWAESIGGASTTRSPEGDVVLLPLWTLLVSPMLVLFDLRRRKELTLLHNLGVATGQAVLIGTLPAVILEALVLLIGR